MDKIQSDKRGSFSFLRAGSHRVADKSSPAVHDVSDDPLLGTCLDDVLREVDRFLVVLSNTDDKSTLPEVPVAVDSLPAKVDAMIGRFEEDDVSLVEAWKRLASLNDLLSEFGSEKSAVHQRTIGGFQRATSFLEKRLRVLLECTEIKTVSFKDCGSGDDFPGYSEYAVEKMRSIATAMIAAGCESEFTTIYHDYRLKAVKSALKRFMIERIAVDDVQKTAWEALECQISSCIQILKACAAVYFPAERNLSESIFSDHPEIHRREYTKLVTVVVTRLLRFIEAVAKTKRSTEKLFKFLDMYECLRDVTPAIDDSDLVAEISSAKELLAEAATAIFTDLEESIRSDGGKSPVPNGAVHPSTRYVMNYLKYACEYKTTLAQVFPPPPPATPNDDGSPENSPFAVQLTKILDLLDESLLTKSDLYRDASLRSVFLMNNGRYVLQKTRGSPEIESLTGDNCYRRRSSAVRKHHKDYTRETWGRLLQTITQQGLQVAGGKLSNKGLLKERLKSFTAMLEEICKTQSAWVVSDGQMQAEMRAAAAAVVIPAYRSFLGRFQQFLPPGREAEKYVKYQPEDIEILIEGLFAGNLAVVGRKTRN